MQSSIVVGSTNFRIWRKTDYRTWPLNHEVSGTLFLLAHTGMLGGSYILPSTQTGTGEWVSIFDPLLHIPIPGCNTTFPADVWQDSGIHHEGIMDSDRCWVWLLVAIKTRETSTSPIYAQQLQELNLLRVSS